MKHFFSVVSILFAVFFSSISYSQELNCNGFLQGNYVEAGINWNGCFGSSTKPPAGFHADTLASLFNDSVSCAGALFHDTSLAFVADPAMDGWSTGTPPYFGDYVLPGGPNEGWSIQAFGQRINIWNSGDEVMTSIDSGYLTSSVINYSSSGGHDTVHTTAVWHSQALQIDQFTALTTNDLFVAVKVIITYTGLGTTPDNVYYLRTINPHNDYRQSGSMATKQRIEYQNPDTLSTALVAAGGTMYPTAYIAMASDDIGTAPVAFMSKRLQLPDSGMLDAIYNEADTDYLYGINDSNTGNTAMGLVFNAGTIGGSPVSFTFYYSFSPIALDTVLHIPPTAVKPVNTVSQNYAVFPNPFTNEFTISGIRNTDNIVVYDMTGRQVTTEIIRKGTNTFQVNQLAAGTYFILVKDEYGNITGKMPVQKM